MPANTEQVKLSQEGLLRALRATVEEGIERVQAEQTIAVVVAPLGAGKTRACVDLMTERGDVAYFAPTHDLVDEVEERLRDLGCESTHMQGVERACEFADQFRQAGRRRDWRGRACPDCPHKASCGAWQAETPGVPLLAPIDLYPTLRDLEGDPLRGRIVLVDEPKPFFDELRFGKEEIGGFRSTNWPSETEVDAFKLSKTLFKLLDAARGVQREQSKKGEWAKRIHGESLLQLWQSTSSEGDLACVRNFVESGKELIRAPEGEELRNGRVSPGDWPSPDTPWFLGALLGLVDPGESSARLKRQHGSVEVFPGERETYFHVIRPRPLKTWSDRGLVLLDATGLLTREATAAAHPEVPIEVVAIDVESHPGTKRVFQATGESERRRTITDGRPNEEAVSRVQREAVRTVALAREHLNRADVRLGIITHKPLVDAISDEIEDWPEDLRDTIVGHYGADHRGTNRFEGVDALLTFGDLIPTVGLSEARARALSIDPKEYHDSIVAAEVAQAQGRARWLWSPCLLRHVGLALPPDWGGRFPFVVDGTKQRDPTTDRTKSWAGQLMLPTHEGKPGRPQRIQEFDVRKATAAMFMERGWAPQTPPSLLLGPEYENALRELYLGYFRSSQARQRAFREAVQQVANEVRAVKVDQRIDGTRVILWTLPGNEDHAVANAQRILSTAAAPDGEPASDPGGSDGPPCALPEYLRAEMIKRYGAPVPFTDCDGKIMPYWKKLFPRQESVRRMRFTESGEIEELDEESS